jgi:phospholipid/cholesterol/gamma-HCH transport system ATP-binding protein
MTASPEAPGPQATREIKVRVSGLTKAFDDTRVLEDIDLAIPAGKNSVLIGPAASGKSVLMKCLVGLYPPDSGSIEVDGQEMTTLRGRERTELVETFGMLFQQGGLFDSLPVWENIAFKLINRHGLDRAKAKELAIEKLAMVNLTPDTADLYPVDLSGGMHKRVGIARAIAGDPDLLLLDEPTAGLDPITTNRINAMVRNAVDKLGATAFCITSDMRSARQHYDHLFMINEGRILWGGPTRDIDQADNPYLQQMINGQAEGPIKMRLRARL